MHVILISGEFPPSPGGVGSYTAQLAAHLVAAGVDISVVAVHSPRDAPTDLDPGYNLLRLTQSWGRTANRRLHRLADSGDHTWVHVQYQTGAFHMNPRINLAARGWRQRGLRVAWTYHDLLPPYLWPKIGRTVRDWVTFRPAHFAEAVISTNPQDCARLQAAGFHAWEIPVPSLMPACHGDAEELAAVRVAYGLSPDDLLLGHVGLALPGKGIQTLVEALRVLRRRGEPARLLLIGGRAGQGTQADRDFRAGLLRQIQRSGMADWVTWTGYLDNAAASAAMACCDMMVMPFTAGASARNSSLMACLAQGSVTITTTPQDARLLPPELPTVPPQRPVALANLIQETFHSPERQHKARQAAATAIQGRTWDDVIRLHLQIYETRLRDPRSGVQEI